MSRRALVLMGVLLAACGDPSLGVEGTCVAIVNIGGTSFTPFDPPAVTPDDVDAAHVVVTRNTGCLDQGEPPGELAPGESNFLDAGTEIHRVDGVASDELLTYWSPFVQEWLPLAPLPRP